MVIFHNATQCASPDNPPPLIIDALARIDPSPFVQSHSAGRLAVRLVPDPHGAIVV